MGASETPTFSASIQTIRKVHWDFPGGPVVRSLHFHCRGFGFNTWSGHYMPHASQHSQKKKKGALEARNDHLAWTYTSISLPTRC